ncbi:MAG: hypothetical protein JSU63_15890 [Phycisphaerales bacterium]|nr:MAG: hypothetical protein JSU63_15890 [Phycisphaerales bacterium]
MNVRVVSIIITAGAVALAALHTFHDSVKVDAIGVALLAIAVLPWIAPFLKTVELPGGFKFALRDEILALPYVVPEIASTDTEAAGQAMAVRAAEGMQPDLSSPEGRAAHRQEIRNNNRGVFLVHVLRPSQRRGQKFDLFIYLKRHKSSSFDDIERAEFFFGKYWGNKIYTGTENNGVIGVSTSAYGSFLCTCRVTFKGEDKHVVMLERYIDFEMGHLFQETA